jgi:hypothetical protein
VSLERALVLVLAACTGDDSGPTCTTYVVPSTTDLTTPVVSLRNDVVPILTNSCAFSSCHGLQSSPGNNGLYLGTQMGTPDASAIHASVLAKAVSYDMPVVTSGDPSQSFLMHKIDGDACTLCKNLCGESMPQGNPVLPVETRDTIRRWIAQGAKDN